MSAMSLSLYWVRRVVRAIGAGVSAARQWLQRFVPGVRARRGAMNGAAGAVILLTGYLGSLLRTGLGLVADIVIGAVAGAVLLFLSVSGLKFVLGLLARLPRRFTATLVGSVLVVMGFLQAPPEMVLPIAGGIVAVAALLGGSVAVLLSESFRGDRWTKKAAILSLVAVSIAAVVWFFVWMGDSGTMEGVTSVKMAPDGTDTLAAPDPSRPGSFSVRYLTYGSGTDRREEFGAKATLTTRSVDAKAFANKVEGWFSPLRKLYWGFDRRKFPLNARVWYPVGNGPFPLVLIVHGNHYMREASDPGYEYLGEFLASRGYVLASVDENFLNGDWSSDYWNENDARAWLLLEHLKAWQTFATDSVGPFAGKVDLGRVALMGHSRGGEAVAIAAAFNRLSRYPDDARVMLDHGYSIKSVVAIAPIDGQYSPAGQPTPVSNVNYLLFQGSHDADLSFFSGDRQYKRITFSGEEYWFKTSIYIYRANHGQFNTVWGNRDYGLPGGYLLNTKPLLSAEEQRTIAKVYIGAFLDATLNGRTEYIPLFRDYRAARRWLPATYFISRFEDSRTKMLCDYSEDIDVTTTTVPGGTISTSNLATWREKDLGLRGVESRRLNQCVILGWKYTVNDSAASPGSVIKGVDPATYTIGLPRGLAASWDIDEQSSLTFALAALDEKPEAAKQDTADDQPQAPDSGKAGTGEATGIASSKDSTSVGVTQMPVDLTVEVVDRGGIAVAIPLHDVIPILPPLRTRFTRYPPWEQRYGKNTETVLQTVEIALSRLRELNPRLEIQGISVIRLRFDRSKEGTVVFDEVGFRRVRK